MESEPHPIYPEGPLCNPYCPGPHSMYHDGYSDGHEAGERFAALDLEVLAKALEWGRDFTLAKATPEEIAAEYQRLRGDCHG